LPLPTAFNCYNHTTYRLHSGIGRRTGTPTNRTNDTWASVERQVLDKALHNGMDSSTGCTSHSGWIPQARSGQLATALARESLSMIIC
jgi:hypothetical protein